MTEGPTPPAPSPGHGRRRGAALAEEEERRLAAERAARAARHRGPDRAEGSAGARPGADAAAERRAPAQTMPEEIAEEIAPEEIAEQAETDAAPGEDPPPAAAAPLAPPRRFRPELQGLRAVAILMVVCYHIWFGRVSGGVDIFLLISAFLLTGTLSRRLEDDSPRAVLAYCVRAFKRLVPPAAVVIVLSVAAVGLLYPPSRYADLADQAFASLTYWENWHLALQGVDYYAADRSAASPFQHFWSLSIQGQVFVLWPLLFTLVALVNRRARVPVRTALLALFGTIFTASLTWSIIETATHQEFAYFDTAARLWEFALGSLLALVLPRLERSRPAEESPRRVGVRAGIGWAAVLAILACGWVVDVDGAFPGWIALWPLLAAGAVIAIGHTGAPWGVDRILASKPLRWVGDISYSLYLVHWPILITALLLLDVPHLDALQGTAVIAASILLGWLLTIGVDTPLRRWMWASARVHRAVAVIAVAALVGALPGMLLQRHTEREVPEAGDAGYPGALSLLPGADPVPSPPAREPFVPALDQTGEQWMWFDQRCSFASGHAELACDQLLPADAHPTATLIAYGNSHTQQFMASLAPIANREGWQVQRPTIGGCDYRLEDVSEECASWNAEMRDMLVAEKPAAVVMQSTMVDRDHGGDEIVDPGYEEAAQYLLDHGIDVIAVRDNPRFAESVPECVHRYGAGSDACSLPRSALYASTDPAPVLTSSTGARVFTVDLTDEYCPDGTCSAVIGNVLVYFDDNHVGKSFGGTLAPFVRTQLQEQDYPF